MHFMSTPGASELKEMSKDQDPNEKAARLQARRRAAVTRTGYQPGCSENPHTPPRPGRWNGFA